MQPLNNFLKGSKKNDSVIAWTPQAEEAFQNTTKKALANATHLAYPNEHAHLELLCDASDFSIGSVLQQKVDGEIQHLGYFSRSLKGPELSYSGYDKEMLSVFASVKYFKHMQLGKKFVIFSDHRPLVNAFRNPSPNHSPKQVQQLCYI